jgi:hypothetical protein
MSVQFKWIYVETEDAGAQICGSAFGVVPHGRSHHSAQFSVIGTFCRGRVRSNWLCEK